MFNKIKNYFLCLRYPFLKCHNAFSDEFLGYDFTWYDDIQEGWRKAFGKELCRNLKKALKKDHCLKTFRFIDIKEKYGALRLYANNFGKESEKVLCYYEALSAGYCIDCGRPARYATRNWVEYYCEDCLADYLSRRDKYATWDDFCQLQDETRLTKEDLPVYNCADPELQKVYDSIDFKKLWGIEE